MTPTARDLPEARRHEPHWIAALQRLDRLTPRESEVFVLMAEGLSNEDMADRLHLTERTVRAHLSAITEKLELNSRLRLCLASYAFRNTVADDNMCRCGRRGE
ncbi:regulatory protein, luxR family [Streptomyces sp. DI166]|uniref:response regulator transcription factor n=1 Tax=unclassified Streptomyces TaxID=2593676 RepID=UPI0007F417B4|nr:MULTISPECIES: LuxR C-terminal-related transcriptional regulator [unclassified Streptomyces]SBT89780.1 regulatory protein, luxR family [Streptomyces sp. DI166]